MHCADNACMQFNISKTTNHLPLTVHKYFG